MKLLHKYPTYDEYINHQRTKTEDPVRRLTWGTDEWDNRVNWFTELFYQNKDIITQCKNSLCVCARMGHEVAALQNYGLESIGIDIVPSRPLVIKGDMHRLDFTSNSLDLIFSNSIDHSLYPSKFISEIERVLKPGGYCFLILQLMDNPDKYAENIILESQDVIDLFKNSLPVVNEYFTLPKVFANEYNWKLIMQKN